MIDLYVIKTTEYMDDGANQATLATKEAVEAWAKSRGFKLVPTEHDADVIDETIKYMHNHYQSLCTEGVFTGGWLKALRKRSKQLRQNAQESN